ncbi:alpha/beta hydrolase [Rhodospirillaceae bacterium KN72]|uniref:Alpha/beta hydrolase n=1 Tax=Pacificispira spongiicola TaxID=2729598 RepID=A0A7Y0DXM1_9PROT|nr:alpha/beta hydrolase [Pacificispira spongiicola]NMM43483.1 alpha/beta hydrolase [Pacificispira spongiicola]
MRDLGPSPIQGSGQALEILRAMPPKGVKTRPTPLVFVHGAFAGAWCWAEHFLQFFAARGYRCIAPSLRGHGESFGRDTIDAYGIYDYVEDIADTISDLSERPVLIGHSMGGFVSMKYAEGHDLAGLVLLASVPPGGLIGPSMSLALWNPMLVYEIGMVQAGQPQAMSVDGMRQALFSNASSKERVERFMPMMGTESQTAVSEMYGLIQVDPTRIRDRMPVFVAGAAQDSLIPPAFIRSTARLFRTDATIYDHIGHSLMLGENWQEAAQHLAHWLDAHDI